MSAKEMFKKLGFICEESDFGISYIYKSIDYQPQYVIEFRFSAKDILFCDDRRYQKLTIEELQAINKQVEELGWK